MGIAVFLALLLVEFRTLLPHPQELLIIPLVPMALVAPDEVEKNSSPLYRYNTASMGKKGRKPARERSL